MCRSEYNANRALSQTAKTQRYPNLQPYANLRHIKRPLTLQTWAKRNIPTILRIVGA